MSSGWRRYDSTQTSFEDLASLASARFRGSRTTFDDFEALAAAHDVYAAARSACEPPPSPPPPRTFDEASRAPAGLRDDARRPGGHATTLDVFLKLRGLGAHADLLFDMGARTVTDLGFLDDGDFAVLGLDRRELLLRVDQ